MIRQLHFAAQHSLVDLSAQPVSNAIWYERRVAAGLSIRATLREMTGVRSSIRSSVLPALRHLSKCSNR
jgi:hypothetical protein